MMDPVRAGTSSRRIRWSSAFVVIILVWSLGLQTKVHGADSARQRASRTQDEAWVEADPYLAYRYITVGWMDWAAVHFGELARSQGDVESWLMAGLTLQSIGDEEAALRAYELGAVLAAGDNRAESAALTLLGYLHSRRGHPDRAKKAFELALELMPENAQAMYGLGGLYAQENRRDEAIKWHRRAAESSRDWIEPVVAAAALLNEDGRFGEALVLLKGRVSPRGRGTRSTITSWAWVMKDSCSRHWRGD